jgi:hypothetical protein
MSGDKIPPIDPVTGKFITPSSGNKESNMSRIGNYVVELEENKIFCINCEQEVDLEQLTDLDICEECYEQQTIDNQLF